MNAKHSAYSAFAEAQNITLVGRKSLSRNVASNKTVRVAGGWLQVFPNIPFLSIERVPNNMEGAVATAHYFPRSRCRQGGAYSSPDRRS